jgi:hypothetical protein
MRIAPFLTLAVVALSACSDSQPLVAPDEAADVSSPAFSNSSRSAMSRYRVTSPGVFVTHSRRASLFEVGERASAGIQEIAENGNPAVAAAALQGRPGVSDVVTTEAPVGRMGGGPFASTLSFEIEADAGANFLSASLMLICTNDGFTGLDAVRLPRGSNEAVFYAEAYDAGTEENDELAGSIVGPCFGIGPVSGLVGGSGRTPEHRRIRHHRNIKGIADLTAAHRWERGPVARVTVQRIN